MKRILLLLALVIIALRPTASLAIPMNVSEALACIPANTETILFAREPTITTRPVNDCSLKALKYLSLSMLFAFDEEAKPEMFEEIKVEYALEAGRNFRPPRGNVTSRYDGAQIIVLKRKLPEYFNSRLNESSHRSFQHS